MAPKRHHYVPIIHLKHFAGQQPPHHVWTYDKVSKDARHSMPDETGLEAHFYSVEQQDGLMDTRLETHLSTIESSAALPYQNMICNNELPIDQERMNFAHFLALLYVRTPTIRRLYGEMSGQMLQSLAFAYGSDDRAFNGLLRRYEADTGKGLSPQQAERLKQDFLDPSNYTMDIHKDRTLSALNIADDLAPILFDMTWTLSTASAGFLFTSDNPILKQYAKDSFNPVCGDGGFKNRTVRISFPLSPKKLLTLRWDRNAPDHCFVSRQYVDGLNEARAAHAERFIYSHIQHKNILRLATKYAALKRKMRVEGLRPGKFAEVKVVRKLK